MPTVNIVFWNIENFGTLPRYKQNYNALATCVARVVAQAQADILFVQEVKPGAIGFQHLQLLLQQLRTLPPPMNNWYYDWIKGALLGPATAHAPWATSAGLDWDAAHYEGYAVFWNQNLAKFGIHVAPPVPGGPPVNTQSETVRTIGTVVFGVGPVPLWGIAVPVGGHVVPANPAYIIPANTVAGPGGITSGGVPVVAAGAAALANIPVNGGTAVPAGTTVGVGGIMLNTLYEGLNPVVVPAGFVLTDPLTLPPPGSTVVPEHALSLVMEGRDTNVGVPGSDNTGVGDISGVTAPFVPGGANNWRRLTFTRGAGHPASLFGTRRPAFVTLDVNIAGAAPPAQRLIPVICYHAPSANPASGAGLQRAAYSRPMYQAYDPAAGAWVDCQRSVLGTDCNVPIDSVAYAYNALTNAFAAGGANCQIRVANPAPPGGTRADNPLNKSTVQLRNPPPMGGGAINSPFTNAYRFFAIDNVLLPGIRGSSGASTGPGWTL